MKNSNIVYRICNKCKVKKPISEFYLSARGNTRRCKECLRELSRQRVADGRDRQSKLRYCEKHGITIKNRLRLTDLQKAANESYRNIKKRCLYNEIDFDIDRLWIEEQFQDFCSKNYHSFDGKNPFQPSIDRINGKKGYTKENVRVCWLIENYCKNTFNDEQVIEFCKRKLGLI